MSYAVKEIYFTFQGEGVHVGRAAVFLRFTGCNLWSGREEDRAAAVCSFCDTDFVGTDGENGLRYRTAKELAAKVVEIWNNATGGAAHLERPFLVCTGGEPLLQLDADLVTAFHEYGITVAVETNGTIVAPDGIDWLCVSPKVGSDLLVQSGNELKLVYPQKGVDPDTFRDLDFQFFSLQPMDGDDLVRNTQLALEYCRLNPRWRLSIQLHKVLGIP